MAVFEYSATDATLRPQAGTVVADTPGQARWQLRSRGLVVTGVRPARLRVGLLNRRRSLRSVQLTAAIRELATLIKAGIPLLEALGTLIEQHTGSLRTALQKLATAVAAGSSLADAMEQMDGAFDRLSISIVRVGENSGQLEDALSQLASFQAKSHRLTSRLTTALAYPAMVSLVGLAVTVFLMTYVVPNLLATLQQGGKPLPALTSAVKAASDLLVGYWWLILIALVAAAAGIRAALSTQRGRWHFDRLMLRTPLLGDLVRKENTSRMAVVMAALLRADVAFVEAVEITRSTLRNRPMRAALSDYAAAVSAGQDIAGPLRASGIFPPMVVQMLCVGQQAGNLEEMLEQLAAAYEQEVDVATQRLSAVLEPLLIVILAVVVGAIALATLLPILELGNVL